jgi:hypothetical protein
MCWRGNFPDRFLISSFGEQGMKLAVFSCQSIVRRVAVKERMSEESQSCDPYECLAAIVSHASK